jgi:hypothetical protein
MRAEYDKSFALKADSSALGPNRLGLYRRNTLNRTRGKGIIEVNAHAVEPKSDWVSRIQENIAVPARDPRPRQFGDMRSSPNGERPGSAHGQRSK